MLKLNKEQREVVLTKHNRTFVNAAPGTGKSTTILGAVIHRIKNVKIQAHKIQVLTFTEDAAKSMKSRIEKELEATTASSVNVNTFHSFAYKYFAKKNILQDCKLATEEDIKGICKKIARKSKHSQTPTQILETITKLEVNNSYLAKKSKNYHILEMFYKYLEESHFWHYDYLLNKLIGILNSKEDKQEFYKMKNSFDFLVVDEYQDCNSNQIELLKILAGKDKSFLFVGDPDQLIYDWRGARISSCVNIENHFKGVEIKSLVVNYRSATEIVRRANNLIKFNVKRLDKKMVASTEEKGRVHYSQIVTEDSIAHEILNKMRKLKGKSVILCSTNKECDLMRSLLVEASCKPSCNYRVMTCHSAKGLEFDNVFIPYATDYNFPLKEAYRRLFYVAITRAKKNLYIYSPVTTETQNKKRQRRYPTKLLEEMGLKKMKGITKNG